MGNELNLKKQVEEWGKEYGVYYDDIHPTYTWIDNHTLGVTLFKSGYNYIDRSCIIKITDVFIDHPVASKAVLWHEFCHAEVWIKDGKTEGHGDKWNGRLWRKPILALLDTFYTQILFMFLKHR